MMRRGLSIRLRAAPLALAAMLGLACSVPPAWAIENIDVTNAHQQPLPIALPDFPGASPQEIELGRK